MNAIEIKSKEKGPLNQRKQGKNQRNINCCYRCGMKSHYGRDPSYPARGQFCRKCGGKNHIAKVCIKEHATEKIGKTYPRDRLVDSGEGLP